jgi:UDP-N-acetylmuramyl pentapeptide phosphotransferase/UDP-N-acetylglucosamine-1-phosphate transferase
MSDMATASLVLSSFVLLVAAFLGWKEWSDRRGRNPDLSPEDARHFGHQDVRRAMGIGVMALLAVGLYVGSRVPHKIANRSNPQFVGIWLGIFLLILFLLGLAMLDWLALRVFARRHRNQILRERIELLKRDKQPRKIEGTNGNGKGHGDRPLGDLFR